MKKFLLPLSLTLFTMNVLASNCKLEVKEKTADFKPIDSDPSKDNRSLVYMAQLGDFSAARGVDEMGLVTISIAHEDGPNTNTKYKQNSSSKIEVVFNVNGSDSATVICDN